MDVPNLVHISQAIKMTDQSWDDERYTLMVCPVCGFNYNHLGKTELIPGKDGYDAWHGRGDLLIVPFSSECGSAWELCLGEHKGESRGFVRIVKSCSESNYLYFIKAEMTGFIKIGRSANPEARLKQLATGSPDKLTLIGKISGAIELEALLHKKFDLAREHGEWFKPSYEILEFIKLAISKASSPQ